MFSSCFRFSHPKKRGEERNRLRELENCPSSHAMQQCSPLYCASHDNIINMTNIPDDLASHPSTRPFLSRAEDDRPLATSIEEIHLAYDKGEQSILVYKFSQLGPDETLIDHVNRQMLITDSFPIGPASESALIYKSPQLGFLIAAIRDASAEEARSFVSQAWKHFTLEKEWRAMVKSIASGIFTPLQGRGVLFGPQSQQRRGKSYLYTHYPIILNDADGTRWWGMISDCSWVADEQQLESSFRDLMTMKHSPSITSLLTAEGGMIWQNASSMELYGVHGQLISPQRSMDGGKTSGRSTPRFNFLDLLFGPELCPQSHQPKMRSVTSKGGTFRVTIEVKDPTLRSLLQLGEGQEMHLDCQVSSSNDPKSFKKVFILNQTDVTVSVDAQRKLEKALKQVEDATIHQIDMIECIQFVSDVGRTAGTQARASRLIESIKRQLTSRIDDVRGGFAVSSFLSSSASHLQHSSKELLGEGGFGRVFKSKWRDLPVAIKIIKVPAAQNARDRRQVLALTELAISSVLLHPNIVKTHTYSIRPVRECPAAAPSDLFSSKSHGISLSSYLKQAPSWFEIQIIMERMDLGSLRGAFSALKSAQPHNYRAVLDIALDVARGIQHLHSCNIIHADLKAPNVLLQSSSIEAKGCVAKIADFGLSLSKDDALSSHVPGFRHGTRSHMAPELLTFSQGVSNSSDVYSYGILLFEIYTGIDAYSDTFHLNFDEMVVCHNHRPTFPPGTPDGYKDLAMACWSKDPLSRPCFASIVSSLTKLRADEEGVTPPLDLSRSNIILLPALDSSWECPLTAPPPPPPPPPPRVAGPPTTNEKAFWVAFLS